MWVRKISMKMVSIEEAFLSGLRGGRLSFFEEATGNINYGV